MNTQEAQAELDVLLPKTLTALAEFSTLTTARDNRLAELREQTNAACTEYRDQLCACALRMQPLMDRRKDLESFLRLELTGGIREL